MTTVTVEEQTIDVTVVEDVITLNVYGGVPSSGGASDVDDLTTESGTDGQYVNVAAEGGLQYRNPADVLSDIGADAAGSAATVQGNLDTHEGNATNPHSVTAAQAGADESGSAAIVAGALSDHEALSTTAHGGIVADSDSRLTDARTPTAHASTHATGEDDPIAAAAIGAEPTITGGTSSQVWNGLKSFVTGVWLNVAQTWTAVQTFSAGAEISDSMEPGDPVVTVTGTTTEGNDTSAVIEFLNPNDSEAPSRYDGEVHVYLRAGETRNERRYFNFRKYDGLTNDWILGANNVDSFILYDAISATHRLWLDPGGETAISSAGTLPIRLQYHSTDDSGKGVDFYGGGAKSQSRKVATIGNEIPGDGTTGTNIDLFTISGKNGIFRFYNEGSVKYFFGLHNSGDLRIYNYGVPGYAIIVEAATNKVTVGDDLVVPGDLTVSGNLNLPNVPTADPAAAGRVWSDGGTLKISAG